MKKTTDLFPKRRWLLGAAASALAAPWVRAQSFATKPIRWVVVAPAGSSLDVIARAMQDKLREQLGTAIVVENKPQAGGTAGTAEVAQSAPDGHTWVMSYNGPLAFGPHLYPRLPYVPLRDLMPVVLTTSQPNLIAVHAGLPVGNLAQLLALLQAHPGKYNFASVGNGSSSHLCMEYIKALSGAFAVHIPFNGGPPAVLATVSGETHMIAAVPTLLTPQIKAGRLKAMAVTGLQRYGLTPEVPTVAESGVASLKGFEAIAWNGVLVAAGTPRPVVERINAAVNLVLLDDAVRQRLQAAGLEPAGGSAEKFTQLIRDESAKWLPIIRRSGATLG
ncbi:MAG: tripartite tricarboxylate transporter substrate binding protein [Betaproteobacteria bacterium]|nr:tripartite tricarboxylate transporter substrate binding protein [Betaproteobacteria bacterium]NBY04990.1 tripartite tricarboxylate transporter substrate binding protein [Betaproteobacteria bacterium]